MSTKFYTLLTDIGAAKLASAAALGVPLKITHMAVGDGGGVLPTPDAKQTALVNEKRRAALNMLYIDPQNSSQIIAEQVIPENEGGWWIREVGLFDESGALIAVGNCPESYKPQLAEGSGRTQTVRMVLITSSTDNITLKIDPAVVLATRKYVDDKALELKVYADDQMAKHLAAPDPHSQYAPKASPTFTGTPKAPTPAAGNNTTQVATTAFVQAALTALINGAPATLDTLKEIAAAINNDPNFSTTINNALALKAPLSSPALTGTPTAPTAAQSVNNTQIATTAFVKSAIAGMVGSAPAALDTLNELAAALGNDPNFATTMLNALAGKQPLDNTLTNLSGKDVAGLLTYLGLRASGQYTDNLLFTGPDGLKIQVFRRTLANLTTVGVVNSVPVTFPVPFPVNCWGVFSTKSSWVQITNSCEWVSNTGFTAQVMMNIAVNTNTSDAMFLAIGY
ncbi:phage tail protein [Escherichia coli]|uniref:phage tail protein n=5 Tax=Escherichia TaxID=561 RepID=UPI001C9A4256|nr:phage tail protein [Escherichia coli]MBY7507550.1 phage tail protein [Escherichia coli]MBY7547278.1 phage tail protein [Escherichia coli]